MSQQPQDDQPWFVELFTSGTSPVPGTTWTVNGEDVDRGSIDLPSGRLRIGVFQMWSSTPPLDEDLVRGEWRVTAVVDAPPSATAGDLLVRLRAVSGSTVVAYRRASRNGRAARTHGRNLIIGDSDISAVLNEDAGGDPLWWLGGPVKKSDAAVADGQRSGLLTDGSRYRAYYLGARGWEPELQHSPLTHRPGRAEIWVGDDANGGICEVVLDFTAIVRAEPFEEAQDPWAASVSGGPGRLLDSPGVVPEPAAVHVLIEEAPPGRLLVLGQASLEGRLCAYDPACPEWGTDLPVEVPAGRYPAFMLAVDRADVMLLRLGERRPERWLRAGGVGVETGQYVVSSTTLRDHIKDAGRLKMQQVAVDLSFDVAAMPGAPARGFVLNSYTHGDVGVDVFVGVRGEAEVVAVIVPLFVERVFSLRPPAEDAEAAQEAQRLRAAAQEGSEAARAFEEEWPELEPAVRSGVLTREQRSSLHWLVEVMRDDLSADP